MLTTYCRNEDLKGLSASADIVTFPSKSNRCGGSEATTLPGFLWVGGRGRRLTNNIWCSQNGQYCSPFSDGFLTYAMPEHIAGGGTLAKRCSQHNAGRRVSKVYRQVLAKWLAKFATSQTPFSFPLSAYRIIYRDIDFFDLCPPRMNAKFWQCNIILHGDNTLSITAVE